MIKQKSYNYFTIFLLIISCIIATYIRANGANYYHYSQDESMIFGIANAKSLLQVLQFSLYETHPPILYILLHYWLMISNQIWFVRCFSLIFGIALIPIYYKIGKKLGGEFTGLCCATLIVFSPICITQSYVLRHYAIMSFLLGITFYLYLLWRDEFKNKQLILYFIFATLAYCTNFSAIFTIFVIASYETINLFIQRIASPKKYKWIATNLIIAAIALIIYYIWKVTIVANLSMSPSSDAESSLLLLKTIFYVPLALGSILPNYYIAFLFLLLLILIPTFTNTNSYRYLIFIFLLSLLLGLFLYYTNTYNVVRQRYCSWLLPFIVPLCAIIIAETCKVLLRNLSAYKQALSKSSIILFFLTVGTLNYNSIDRFNNNSEYMLQETEWHNIVRYINNLDNKSILLAERDDAILLNDDYPYFNLFQFFDNDAFYQNYSSTIIPYNNTNIIFSQYYRRFTDKNILTKILTQPKNNSSLAGYNNIVIMETKFTGWNFNTSPIQLLILCPELDKKITYFPESRQGEKITKENIYDFDALFMNVSKKDLFEQVIAENGKAHYCLDKKLKDD